MVNITMLSDNTSLGGLESEHGFSLEVETETKKILFDTGGSDLFLRNAEKVGKKLSDTDALVISHAHYDHAGGLWALVERGFQLPYYTGEGFDTPKYSSVSGELKYLGPPVSEGQLAVRGWEHRILTNKQSIQPLFTPEDRLWLVTGFDRTDQYETIPEKFVLVLEDGSIVRDTFDDEVLLVVETNAGLVVVVGCSHPGIINMLTKVQSLFSKHIEAVIGGTHLMHADRQRILHTADTLKEMQVHTVALSHCTGQKAVDMFREQGLQVAATGAGTVYSWQ